MSTNPDGPTFVAELIDEMADLFEQLEADEALANESGGKVEIPTLLELAMASEYEAAEVAGLWIHTTEQLDIKALFAEQVSDELRHYDLIRERLTEMGFEPPAPTKPDGALYHYLVSLRTPEERLAAGPFSTEAVAEVRNAQFIELCHRHGDTETAALYEQTVQPEEVHHKESAQRLLARYVVTAEQQERARNAMRTSLAITEELRSLTEKITGLTAIPVS